MVGVLDTVELSIKKLIYYARPINLNNLPPGYLRVSRYYSIIDTTLNRINYHIIYVLFFSLIISGIIISYFIILIIKRLNYYRFSRIFKSGETGEINKKISSQGI